MKKIDYLELSTEELIELYDKHIDAQKKIPSELIKVLEYRGIGTDFVSMYYFDNIKHI